MTETNRVKVQLGHLLESDYNNPVIPVTQKSQGTRVMLVRLSSVNTNGLKHKERILA